MKGEEAREEEVTSINMEITDEGMTGEKTKRRTRRRKQGEESE